MPLVRLLAALVFVALALPAAAEPPGPLLRKVYPATVSGVAWSDKALNAVHTTDWIYVEGYNQIAAVFTYTWTSATHVTMKCWESDDGTDARAFEIPACDEAVRPNSDCEQRLWRYVTGGASHNFRFPYIPLQSPYIKCQVTSVGGAAGDVANTFKFVAAVQ